MHLWACTLSCTLYRHLTNPALAPRRTMWLYQDGIRHAGKSADAMIAFSNELSDVRARPEHRLHRRDTRLARVCCGELAAPHWRALRSATREAGALLRTDRGSVADRGEVASTGLGIRAHGHQRHRLDDPQPARQAPAEQPRLSHRVEERERRPTRRHDAT